MVVVKKAKNIKEMTRMESVVYSIVEKNIEKKTIGVFGGRFQPFHSGHMATYKWL